MKKFEIVFNASNYFPGDQIEGIVHIDLNRPIQIKSIVLKVVGIGHIYNLQWNTILYTVIKSRTFGNFRAIFCKKFFIIFCKMML